jgi:hypothetical protein
VGADSQHSGATDRQCSSTASTAWCPAVTQVRPAPHLLPGDDDVSLPLDVSLHEKDVRSAHEDTAPIDLSFLARCDLALSPTLLLPAAVPAVADRMNGRTSHAVGRQSRCQSHTFALFTHLNPGSQAQFEVLSRQEQALTLGLEA